MKRQFGWLLIALAIVLSASAAQGQNKPKEVMAEGSVPAGWGTLRGMMAGSSNWETRLFFEDSKGTVRMVTLSCEGELDCSVTPAKGSVAVVIKRSK